MIKFVKYRSIDIKAWDTCVKQSINKDVTVLSGYLDVSCKKWDALILDSYKAVMPLPRVNNGLVNNYSTSFLVPQLGVYGNGVNKYVFAEFIKCIKNKFDNYKVNKYNYYTEFDSKYDKINAYEFDIYTKTNLSINKKYSIVKRISNNEIIKFIEDNNVISNIKFSEYKKDVFRQILAYTIRHEIAYCYAAYDEYNIFVGFAFFVKSFSKDKLIFLAIKDKNNINEIFKFLLNNHLSKCRLNISIDLGYSDTYFDNVFKLFGKSYVISIINKK